MIYIQKCCCFSGHRIIPDKDIYKITKRLENEIVKLINQGVIYFGVGGAIGFDTLCAITVLKIKKTYPQIKLIIVVPFKEQDKCFSDSQKITYHEILGKADKVIVLLEKYQKGCYFIRNRHLVDNSSYCICYKTKNDSGTAYTVQYATEKGKKVINIAIDSFIT